MTDPFGRWVLEATVQLLRDEDAGALRPLHSVGEADLRAVIEQCERHLAEATEDGSALDESHLARLTAAMHRADLVTRMFGANTTMRSVGIMAPKG